MLYATHLLPRGYFHTKDWMISVKIVEVIERTRIRLQMDRRADEQTDGQETGYSMVVTYDIPMLWDFQI